jgi:hypothetical protein
VSAALPAPAALPLPLPLPALVAHADWSVAPAGRWLAVARRQPGGHYQLHAPVPAGPPPTLLARLRRGLRRGGRRASGAGRRTVFLGLDVPIGVPAAYAARAGIADFRALLDALGEGAAGDRSGWEDFGRVADRPEAISLRRPFYPLRPGGASPGHLVTALGLDGVGELHRECERATAARRAAAPLFWTLGAQQVGKAALSVWIQVLAPARRAAAGGGAPCRLWPFDGDLPELLGAGSHDGGVVVAEVYPGECYAHLGVTFPRRRRAGAGAGPEGGGKGSPEARRAAAAPLLRWIAGAPVAATPALRRALAAGFPAASGGADAFDATVGLLGTLNVLLGRRPAGPPVTPPARRVEGWILGQSGA